MGHPCLKRLALVMAAVVAPAQAEVVYNNYTPGQTPGDYGPETLTATTEQLFSTTQGFFQANEVVQTQFTIFGSEAKPLNFPDAELIIPLHISSDSNGFSIDKIDITIEDASGTVFNNGATGTLDRSEMVFDETWEYTVQMNGALQPGVTQVLTVAATASATTTATNADLFKVFSSDAPGTTEVGFANSAADSFDSELAFLVSDAPYNIPEPGSLALLGIGAAVLIRRRSVSNSV